MSPSPTFEHHTLCVGALGPRLHGSPLTPPDQQSDLTHQTWFVNAAGGVVGAFEHNGELHVAAGTNGRIWQLDGGRARALELRDVMPEALRWTAAKPEPDTGHHGARRSMLHRLRWARVTPVIGQRLLLVDGLDPDIEQLPLKAESSELIAALRPPVAAAPSGWRRLLPSRRPAAGGAALLLERVEAPPLPDGLTPWLRAQEQRGMSLDWMGNEAGNYPLRLFERPPPAAAQSLKTALLDIARDQLERASEDVWTEWASDGVPMQGYQELVEGEPQRGWWRDASVEELESGLELRGSEYADRGTPNAQLVWSRFVCGADLLDRLRRSVEQLCAVAVFDVPDDECVVVWYLLGGISRVSGQLEVVALERVWS